MTVSALLFVATAALPYTGEAHPDPFERVLAKLAAAIDTPREPEVFIEIEGIARSVASQPGCARIADAIRRERDLALGASSQERRLLHVWLEDTDSTDSSLVPPLGLAGAAIALRRALRLEDASRLDEAQHPAALAAEAAEALGWQRARCRAARILARCLTDAGRFDQALAIQERLEPELEQLGLSAELSLAVANRARALQRLGRYEDSLEACDQILRGDLAPEPIVAVDALCSRADTLNGLRRPGEALAAALEARRLSLEHGEHERANVSLSCVVWSFQQAGRLDAALSCAERTLENARRLGTVRNVAAAVQTVAGLRLMIGDHEAARVAALEAIDLFGRMGAAQEGGARLVLGYAYMKGGDEESAEREFRVALRRASEAGDRPLLVTILMALGNVAFQRGQVEQALLQYERTRALAARLGNSEAISASVGAMATLLARRGDLPGGLALFDEAIETAKQLGDPRLQAWSMDERSIALAGAGRLEEAVREAEKALELLDFWRNGLGELEAPSLQIEEARVASNAASFLVKILRSGETGGNGLHSTLFRLVERARGQTLLETLVAAKAEARGRIPEELLRAEAEARQRAAAAQLAKSSGSSGDATLDAAYADCIRATGRVQRALANAGIPSAAAPISLVAFQRLLPAGTAYLAFVEAPRDYAAILVTRDASRLAVIEGRQAIEKELAAFLARVATPTSSLEEIVSLGGPLRDRLLGPFDAELAGRSRIVICPCGSLARLPFEALPEARVPGDDSAPRFLLDRFETSYATSASVQAWLAAQAARAPAARRSAVVCAPRVAGFPELRHAEAEATQVALALGGNDVSVLSGGAARERDVRRVFASVGRERFRVVHFACHGVVDPERPLLSALVLSEEAPGADDDGRLTAIEISRMRIPSDLAVLSACRTSEGPWRPGEGVTGFVRALLMAGCERIIVSQWAVDDEASRALAEGLYESFQRGGLGASGALCRAKRQVRATVARDTASARGSLERARTAVRADWRHPYYWAPFVLWGRED